MVILVLGTQLGQLGRGHHGPKEAEESANARLVHGEATTDPEGTTTLVIADDGVGASLESITTGVGSAIIDSWVSILKGVKEIDTMPGHGFRIQITFPQ